MARDTTTGVEPRARDGQPNGKVDELEREREKLRGQDIDSNGVGEEDDGQLFVWESDTKVTLGTLIKRGTPVEHAFVFGSKRLKASGALVGQEEDVLVVVRGRVAKTVVVPTRDDSENVTKVVVESHIRPQAIVPGGTAEATAMLEGAS